MVRIRLRRVGAKNQPSYRVVVADGRSPRDGRFIEKIGFYNPRTEPSTIEIDEERALHWLNNGAQPSNAVRRLLVKMGTMDRFERLRKGEALEALLAEAEAEAVARKPVDPRTRRDEVAKAPKKAKAEEKPVAEAVEVEAEVEETVEEIVEAEKDTVEETAEEEAEEEEAEEAANSEVEEEIEEAQDEAEPEPEEE
ncbi:MAG: 30S ribosomal protein S16 [Anaerolineae bacterium]|nr:30S ribosomal protein S16 [Anaerolineae bacterium]